MSQADARHSDNLCKSAPGISGDVTDRSIEWNPRDWLREFECVGGYVTSKGIGWFTRDHEVSYLRATATRLIEELEAEPRRYLELRFYLDMRKVAA
jgi:hypothetical protein